MNTKGVSYQQLRSATGKVIYNGTTFLIDPMLAEKGRYEGFAGTFNAEVRNPTVELPESKEKIMEGVDAVIVTHTHLDHWDEVAQQFIDKKIPFFVQDEADAAAIRKAGFKNVTVLDGSAEFGGVTLTRVEGTHGTQAMYDDAGRRSCSAKAWAWSSPRREKRPYICSATLFGRRASRRRSTPSSPTCSS